MSLYQKLLRRTGTFEQLRRRKYEAAMRRMGLDPSGPRKKPPESGIAVPAIPPRGPLPLQGGAEVPLEFD